MTKILVLLIGLALAGTAQAQIKCWTGADGKRACGDVPPTGAKVTTVKVPVTPTDVAPASKDAAAKDAKKGPLTPAEREMEYRKSQAEAQKAAAKADQAKKDAQTSIDNCTRARAAARTLESGERVATTDEKGERLYLNDEQIAKQAAFARQQVIDWCK